MPKISNPHWVYRAKDNCYCTALDYFIGGAEFCGYCGSMSGRDAVVCSTILFLVSSPLDILLLHFCRDLLDI